MKQDRSGKDVVILGAGLAGLAAAETLARCGQSQFRITVLEAKRIAGGRAGSFTDPMTGETIDYCQHVAMGCCTNLLALLDRCGLSQSMDRYDRLMFHHGGFPPSPFEPSRWLPAPLHLAGVLSTQRYLGPKQRREIYRALFHLLRIKSETLRSTTAAAWLGLQNQSAESMEKFWEVIVSSALGDCCERVSMAAARKVFVDGFAAAKGASDVLIPNRPLSELFGCDLVDSIKRLGVAFYFQTPVRRVLTPNGRLVGVETRSGTPFHADAVISGLPWHSITNLFDAPEQQFIQRTFEYVKSIVASPITGIHLWTDGKITDRPHAVLVGGMAQWLFRRPLENYYQVVISGAHPMSDLPRSEWVAQVWRELGAVFPDALRCKLLQWRVVSDPLAVFSLSPSTDAIRPPPLCPPLPHFYLAGDWTATTWPATMEGAVISGIRAASCVLEQFGLPGQEPDCGLTRGWLARRFIAK